MAMKMVKITKLEEMTAYEDPKTAKVHHSSKKWTKGVPIVLLDNEGTLITTDHWVYLNKSDELVYNKKKNLWTQGSEFYNIGKSHIREIHVIVNEKG